MKKFIKFFLEKFEKIKIFIEGKRRYSKLVWHFIQDGNLDPSEVRQLDLVAKQYKLKCTTLKKIQKKNLKKYYKKLIQQNSISQIEKKSLEMLLVQFKSTLKDVGYSHKEFGKLYTLGLIESGSLPVYSNATHYLNVKFKKNERLHYCEESDWRKLKKITKRYNYTGPVVSIRIAKGIRYRLGSISLQPIKEELVAKEDTGTFYITSLKVGFIGDKKHFSVDLKKIFSIDFNRGCMRIFKEGRESPYMVTLRDYEVPFCIMSFLLNNHNL